MSYTDKGYEEDHGFSEERVDNFGGRETRVVIFIKYPTEFANDEWAEIVTAAMEAGHAKIEELKNFRKKQMSN